MDGISSSALWLLALPAAALAYACFPRAAAHQIPGPRGLPLVGNTFQLPKDFAWLWFAEIGRKYGRLFRLSLAGDNVIVLNDPADATELLTKRAANFSSRKQLVYAGKYLSNNLRTLLLPYNNLLLKERAVFTSALHLREAHRSYEPQLALEAKKLAFDMLEQPHEHARNTKRFASCSLMSISYGRRFGEDDKDLLDVQDILQGFIHSVTPGAFLIDLFPSLDKILPDFLAPYRAQGKKQYNADFSVYGRLAEDVRQRWQRDAYDECLAAKFWEASEKQNFKPEEIAYAVGTSFEAGTGALGYAIQVFLLACAVFPDIALRAQKELDDVLGPEVEPTFKDIERLPYMRGIVKETFRWRPSIPNGFQHLADADEMYKGYKIPANSVLLPNIWAMHHNEDLYPSPDKFDPLRWATDKSSLSEGTFIFGFGRRVCPGRDLAARAVFAAVARLIFHFNIRRKKDRQGRDIIPKYGGRDFIPGILIGPEPFEVDVAPRSEAHAQWVREAWAAAREAL